MKVRLGILGASVCLAVLDVPAQAQGVEACVQMQSSLRRLDCYDGLFRGKLTAQDETKADLKAAAPSVVVPKVTGSVRRSDHLPTSNPNAKTTKFQSRTQARPGRTSWTLSSKQGGPLLATQSQRVHRNLVGHKSRLSLQIACRNNTTSLELRFGGNIVASALDSAQLRFIVDDRPAASYQFSVANDFKAVGLWSGEEAIPVIKSLMGASSLTVEGAPYFSRPVKAGFRIDGLDATIRAVRGSCNW